MQEKELNFYEKLGNWDFSDIKCTTEKITDWDFYDKIKENTNEKSLCLDIGTGGGEKVLAYYPDVGMIIATEFSNSMLATAKKNAEKYPDKKVKFTWMDNLNMTFPNETFDLISARHTIIDANQIYNCLVPKGVIVIEGIDKEDCIEIKDLFGRGQGYHDKISIADKDYNDLKEAGFYEIEKVKIIEHEYYQTPEDLLALLQKTPILDDFSEFEENGRWVHSEKIEKDLFDEYVRKNITEKGILLKRVLYGIVAKK